MARASSDGERRARVTAAHRGRCAPWPSSAPQRARHANSPQSTSPAVRAGGCVCGGTTYPALDVHLALAPDARSHAPSPRQHRRHAHHAGAGRSAEQCAAACEAHPCPPGTPLDQRVILTELGGVLPPLRPLARRRHRILERLANRPPMSPTYTDPRGLADRRHRLLSLPSPPDLLEHLHSRLPLHTPPPKLLMRLGGST